MDYEKLRFSFVGRIAFTLKEEPKEEEGQIRITEEEEEEEEGRKNAMTMKQGDDDAEQRGSKKRKIGEEEEEEEDLSVEDRCWTKRKSNTRNRRRRRRRRRRRSQRRRRRRRSEKECKDRNNRQGSDFRGITDGRDGGHDLSELQLVQNGGLPCSVEADHQDPHLLLREQSLEELGEGEAHGDGLCRSASVFLSIC
jgi:hypothetical protein